MSTINNPLVVNGRIAGCYVYMALCQDGADIHIKIGLSQEPAKRVLALFHNNPLLIECLAVVDLPSRRIARRLERDLHEAMKKWRTCGEWFCFSLADRAEFNRLQKASLAKYASGSRPLRWTKMNVPQLAIESLKRRWRYQQKWASSGAAYRDAIASSRQ